MTISQAQKDGADAFSGKRIVVLGAGAVGGYVGGYLAAAGSDVTLVDGWYDHIETMRRDGLRLSGRSADEDLIVRPKTVHLHEFTGIANRRPIDIVLISMKSYDTEWVTTLIRPFLAPSGYVVSLQNAMNEEAIAGIVGWGRTVGCIASSISVELHAPGQIRRQAQKGKADAVFRVGEIHGRVTARAEELAAGLRAIDTAEVITNLWGERWAKLAHNAMRNSIAAATGLGSREIDESAAMRRFSILIGGEAVRIGLALGFELAMIGKLTPNDLLRAAAGDEAAFRAVDEAIAVRTRSGATGALQRASMGQDVLKGRRTEIDEINGLIVARGKEAGIETPANARVTELVHRIERGELAPSIDNIPEAWLH